MLSLYHVILLVSFLCRLYPLWNELFTFSLTLIVIFNYEYRCIHEGECIIMIMWRCTGRGCICNYYVNLFLQYVLGTILICIQFPVFFKKETILIISPIISFQILIFKWETFEISLINTVQCIITMCALHKQYMHGGHLFIYIYTQPSINVWWWLYFWCYTGTISLCL